MNYYTQLDIALKTIRQKINQVQLQTTDEFDLIDYSTVLNDLTQLEKKIVRMLNIHRFLRISKEAFLFGQKPLTYKEIYHTVAEYETIFDIAKKYSVTVDDILSINMVTINNISAGMQLKILQYDTAYLKVIESDFPVYGELNKENILGKDLPKTLIDDENGDLLILNTEDTFTQSILIRLTTNIGEYPGENDFGFDFRNKNGLTEEVFQNMIKVKIANNLLADQRVKDIKNISLTRKQNALIANIHLETVNDKDFNIGIIQ
jgi:LysM repeat protein